MIFNETHTDIIADAVTASGSFDDDYETIDLMTHVRAYELNDVLTDEYLVVIVGRYEDGSSIETRMLSISNDQLDYNERISLYHTHNYNDRTIYPVTDRNL